MKTGVTRLRSNLNISSMFFHNALRCIEAEACSLTDSFGSEKRFEDVGLDLGRDSGTVVANLDDDAIIVAIGSNSQLAFAAHGIDGIVDNVSPHLIEFAAK